MLSSVAQSSSPSRSRRVVALPRCPRVVPARFWVWRGGALVLSPAGRRGLSLWRAASRVVAWGCCFRPGCSVCSARRPGSSGPGLGCPVVAACSAFLLSPVPVPPPPPPPARPRAGRGASAPPPLRGGRRAAAAGAPAAAAPAAGAPGPAARPAPSSFVFPRPCSSCPGLGSSGCACFPPPAGTGTYGNLLRDLAHTIH